MLYFVWLVGWFHLFVWVFVVEGKVACLVGCLLVCLCVCLESKASSFVWLVGCLLAWKVKVGVFACFCCCLYS